MGLLVSGVPLDWASAQDFLEYVKKHGVQQFLNVLDNFKDRKDDGFLWGTAHTLKHAPLSRSAALLLLRRVPH